MTVMSYPWLPGPLNDLRLAVEYGLRNGVVPPGPELRGMADVSNTILAHRQKVLFRKNLSPGASGTSTYADAYNGTAAATTWRVRFHTSPGMGSVKCRYILIPVDNTVGNAPTPRARWSTTPDGGATTNQEYIYQNIRIAAGAAVTQDMWTVIDQPFTDILPDTSYQATFEQENQLRVIGCVIHEIPRVSLDTASDTYAVDRAQFAQNAPIYDRDALDLFAAATRLYKRQGTNFFNYTRPGATARTTTSTSDVNILSGSTGVWATDAAGFVTNPQKHGSHETYNSGTNRETVPVHCWAVISVTGGATATVTFRDSIGTIATLTTTSATPVFVTDDTTWTAASNATSKVEVVMKSSSGAQTVSIWAAGMYHYEA